MIARLDRKVLLLENSIASEFYGPLVLPGLSIGGDLGEVITLGARILP